MCTVNGGRPLGREGRKDEGRAGAQVADVDVRAVEVAGAPDAGVARVDDLGPGAHPVQLLEPLEAVLEDRLVDVGRARRLRQQHRRRWLEVRRQAWIGGGLDVAGVETVTLERRAVDLDRV